MKIPGANASRLAGVARWLIAALAVSLTLVGCVDRNDYIPNQSEQSPDTEGPTPNPGLDAGTDRDGSSRGGDTSRRPEDVDTSWGFGDGGTLGEPSIEQIVPPSGPVEGGNRVRIDGENLVPSMTFLVGGREMPVEVSAGSLIGRVPASSGPGQVGVKVLPGDGSSLSLPKGYEYVPGLEIETVSPSSVPVEGGVEVTIRGRGFAEKVAVSVDDASAHRVERIDSQMIRAIVPAGDVGPADVRVTTPEAATTKRGAIQYVEGLEIRKIRPASGTTNGGTSVDIQVDGLVSEPTVTFDGQPATVTDVDPQTDTISVTTPPHTTGLVDVGVQTSNGATLRLDGYMYVDGATTSVGAIHPSSGPVAGGTEVTITGNGLDQSNLSVRFGGVSGQILDAGDSYIEVETPAVNSPGSVDVQVSASGSPIGDLPNGFTYQKALSVDSVSPGSGPVAGGQQVTITGDGFQGASNVEFGGLPSAFQVVSDTEISVTTPAHTAGPTDVVVRRGQVTARLDDGYQYEAPLEVWGFEPVRGAVAGGTFVRVRGRGFNGDLSATFDAKEAESVSKIDDNNLTLRTPPHEEGEVRVEVSADSKTSEGPYPYQYFNPTSRSGGASGGEIDGAVNVTVLATNGGPVPGAYVMLSTSADSAYQGITNQSGQVTLSGPDVLGPQTVTATAPGYTATTVHTVNAENITIYITKLNTPPPEPGEGGGGGGDPPPRSTIEGTVQMPPKMADPDDKSTGDMAMVRTTTGTRYGRTPDPGNASVRFGTGSYTLNSRVGELAVVALCGVHDSDTNQFEAEFIGVTRHVKTTDRQTSRADVHCDIPLNQSLAVKLTNPDFAPSGPNINRATVYWDFGTDGVFEAPATGESSTRIISVPRQPKLDGRISDATFTVDAGSYTGASFPLVQSTETGISGTDAIVSMPPLVEIPRLATPSPGGMVNGGEIRFSASPPYWPTMWSVYLLNTQGTIVWHHLVNGSQTTFRLPDFGTMPDGTSGAEVSPISGGTYYLFVRGIDAPASTFDNFSYDTLSFTTWRGYSFNRWLIRLPSP
jgi:hypothetical protein